MDNLTGKHRHDEHDDDDHDVEPDTPPHGIMYYFLPCDAMQSAVMRLYAVCPSVTFRYRDHTGWNTVKKIHGTAD